MNLKSLIRKPMKRRLFLCGIGFLIVGFIMIIVNMEDYNENILYKQKNGITRKMRKEYNNPFIRHAETLRKEVVQYDLSGQIVDTFDSITEACNKTGISSRCIHGTLNGKRPHTHGYVFKFKNDN